MSEVLRTFEPGLKYPSKKRFLSFKRSKKLRRILAVIGVIFLLAWWYTRDSVSIKTFIPANASYHLIASSPFSEGGIAAESPLWHLLPHSLNLPEMLQENPASSQLFTWVIANFLGDICYLSGNDVHHFEDAVLVSRMTRLGKMIEPFFRHVSNIEKDEAGGLNLYLSPTHNIWYTVRGRLILASRSRSALIDRLVLLPQQRVSDEQFEYLFSDISRISVRGMLGLPSDTKWQSYIQWAGFACSLQPQSLYCKFKLIPGNTMRSQFSSFYQDLQPGELRLPPPAMLEIAANFGKPLNNVVSNLLNALGSPSLEQLTNQDRTDKPILIPQLDAFLQMLGPRFSVGWYSVDLNEILPVPEIAAFIEGNPTVLQGLLELIPPVPVEANPWDPILQYDPTQRRAILPLIGGQTLQPTFLVYQDCLMISSSTPLAERLLQNSPSFTTYSKPGNLLIRLQPKEICQTIGTVGKLLAEYNLLKNHTTESFEQMYSLWAQKLENINRIEMLFTFEQDAFNGEIIIEEQIPSS